MLGREPQRWDDVTVGIVDADGEGRDLRITVGGIS